MRFLFRVCQFFFFCGLLLMFIGTADELFDLGIWHGQYPLGDYNKQGEQLPATYGHFMMWAGIITAVAFLLGTFLMYRLRRRAIGVFLFMEAIRVQGFTEALDGRREEVVELDELPAGEQPSNSLEELERKYGVELQDP